MITTNDLIIQFLMLAILVILMLLSHRSNLDKSLKYLFFLVILLESITTFFFFTNKVHIFFSVALFFSSLFFIVKVKDNFSHKKSQVNIFNNSVLDKFRITGIIITLCVIALELLIFDGSFSSMSIFSVGFGIFLIIYKDIDQKYNSEKEFTFVFMVFLTLLIIFPSLVHKLGYTESNKVFWYSSPEFVGLVLAKPLVNFLSLFGFVVYNKLDVIYYQDTVEGITKSVLIGEGCSGLHSVSIFLCAFISYGFMQYRKLTPSFFVFMVIGIFFSYIANLFRMSIIIVVGHYYGYEALLWTHQNVGMIIFILWVSFFWYAFEKANLLHLGNGYIEQGK